MVAKKEETIEALIERIENTLTTGVTYHGMKLTMEETLEVLKVWKKMGDEAQAAHRRGEW